jgi:hypothetical protein
VAWSPVRRTNAGRFEVDHPGDYATFNPYHPSYDGRCRSKAAWSVAADAPEQRDTSRSRTVKNETRPDRPVEPCPI